MQLILVLCEFEENGPRSVEARVCGAPSQKFKGICLSDRNCGNVCESEGFPSGNCQGLRRRCFCTRPC